MFWRELYSVEEAGGHPSRFSARLLLGRRARSALLLRSDRLSTFAPVEQLMTLIGAAKEHAIEFIYAISPGLDITFSNQKEVSALKRKLDQVLQRWRFCKGASCRLPIH